MPEIIHALGGGCVNAYTRTHTNILTFCTKVIFKKRGTLQPAAGTRLNYKNEIVYGMRNIAALTLLQIISIKGI